MKPKSKTRTEQILKIMHVLAWIAFIGAMIKAGAILVAYGVSCVNRKAVKHLYIGLDLSNILEFGFLPYTLNVFSIIAIEILKAVVCYLLIKILSKINLINPFITDVVKTVEKISYIFLAIWMITVLTTAFTDALLKPSGNNESGEYLFTAGLVFIISQVFKRGAEIQSENELTV